MSYEFKASPGHLERLLSNEVKSGEDPAQRNSACLACIWPQVISSTTKGRSCDGTSDNSTIPGILNKHPIPEMRKQRLKWAQMGLGPTAVSAAASPPFWNIAGLSHPQPLTHRGPGMKNG